MRDADEAATRAPLTRLSLPQVASVTPQSLFRPPRPKNADLETFLIEAPPLTG